MYAQQQMKSYKRAEGISASKLAQVAILLETCTQYLQRAIYAIEQGDLEDRFNATDKVSVILSSIQGALAVDSSEAARDMHRFFQDAIIMLLRVNMDNNIELCRTVRENLIEMALIWRTADRNLDSGAKNLESETQGFESEI